MVKHNQQVETVNTQMCNRWRTARMNKNMDIKDVVRELGKYGYGISLASFSTFERGETQPKHLMVMIGCLCAIYNVTPNEILGAEESH